MDVGKVDLGLDRACSSSAGERRVSDSASVFYLRRDLTGVLHYLAPREGAGRSGLEWSVPHIGRGGRQVFFSSSSSGQGGLGDDRSYRLGARLPVGRRVQAQAAGADFGFLRRERPVVFDELASDRGQEAIAGAADAR